MAVKVALAAALLVALVALATATTYTTTVTTTTFEDDATNPQQQCSRQLQGRRFRSCQSYLKQRGSNLFEQEEDVIEMSTNTREFQDQCCQELREVDRQGCGCQAIKQAVREVQQRAPQGQQGQSEQIYQRARQLPNICRLSSKQCQFHVVFV